LPASSHPADNRVVKDGSWIVVKSGSFNRNSLLTNLLSDRFPQSSFRYIRFLKAKIQACRKADNTNAGVIAELKKFDENGLECFDLLTKTFQGLPIIFILSPLSYNILSRKRRKILDEQVIVISEVKSLDYLAQLPRLIEELSLRQRLRDENQELHELVQERRHQSRHLEKFSDFLNSKVLRNPKGDSAAQGLQVTIQGWAQIKRRLGVNACSEFAALLSREISLVIRSTDRLLRSKENEFIIFLSNVSQDQISHCMNRIKTALNRVEIEVNRQLIEIPFSVKKVKNLSYTP